jgi:hypothetical protein
MMIGLRAYRIGTHTPKSEISPSRGESVLPDGWSGLTAVIRQLSYRSSGSADCWPSLTKVP